MTAETHKLIVPTDVDERTEQEKAPVGCFKRNFTKLSFLKWFLVIVVFCSLLSTEVWKFGRLPTFTSHGLGASLALYAASTELEKPFVQPNKYLSSNLASSSRLGNHLFELSSLLAISRKLNRTPTVFVVEPYHEKMLQDTDLVIPGLLDHFLIINSTVPPTITPTDFQMRCCFWDDPDRLKNITDEYLHIRGTHYQSWKYFPRLRNELMSYLAPPTHDFEDLPKSNDITKVTCVHIRRTDFVGSGFYVPDEKFILSAMQSVEQAEKRTKQVVMRTVFFGDDFAFMENLSNMSFAMSNGLLKDLKTESFISRDNPSDSIIYSKYNCDVVLFTSPHSTFGWWLGYLSKGNQVYYTDIRYTDDVSIPSGTFSADDYYPTNWIPLRYNGPDNITVVETLK